MAKVEYFNRYTGKVEEEQIYGEGFLRWTYGNPLGKISLEGLVKRAFFSRWYGGRMNSPASRAKVAPFIQTYGLKAEEFADLPDSFNTFNEFFYRKLKPGARPIHADPNSAVFTADGRHLGFQNIHEAEGIFVKGGEVPDREIVRQRGVGAAVPGGHGGALAALPGGLPSVSLSRIGSAERAAPDQWCALLGEPAGVEKEHQLSHGK